MEKFTPGPWHWDEEGLGNKNHIVFGRDYPVGMISDSNKRLIVAAPELLEALQEAMKFSMSEEAYNKCAAAVSKALGQ